jgi:hypothetical protein
MRNHRNAIAILAVLLTFWVMLVATTARPLRLAIQRAAWEPTPEHCGGPDSTRTERQHIACELAADTAYGPSLEESR